MITTDLDKKMLCVVELLSNSSHCCTSHLIFAMLTFKALTVIGSMLIPCIIYCCWKKNTMSTNDELLLKAE